MTSLAERLFSQPLYLELPSDLHQHAPGGNLAFGAIGLFKSRPAVGVCEEKYAKSVDCDTIDELNARLEQGETLLIVCKTCKCPFHIKEEKGGVVTFSLALPLPPSGTDPYQSDESL